STNGKLTSAKTTNVSGSYWPFAGDFDGDGKADIFWYGPGATQDSVWYGSGTFGSFTSVKFTVSGVYQPLVGRFTGGDARDDVLWFNGSNATTSPIWRGNANRTFS